MGGSDLAQVHHWVVLAEALGAIDAHGQQRVSHGAVLHSPVVLPLHICTHPAPACMHPPSQPASSARKNDAQQREEEEEEEEEEK